MLWDVADRHPQFRKLLIRRVPPRPKTAIDSEYRINISQAWTRLNSTAPPASEVTAIAVFNKKFKRDCAASYSHHDEIQLFSYHQDNSNLSPSLPYFGCSKKACLQCEGFLSALSAPVAT